jgi:hypothetical protein
VAPGLSPAEDLPGRTFRRSLSARAVSVVALLMFGLALATRTTARDFGAAWTVLAALTIASIAGVVGAWGDRITIDSRGVESRNVLLPFAGRRIAWSEVLRIQEHRRPGSGASEPPRALFLVPVKGRRMALDSLEDFDQVARLVARGGAKNGAASGQ